MTTLRKNQFEELIDAMMIEEVAGLDKDIRETLEGLPTEKKRMAILSILDKDRDMFMKIKRMVDDSDVTKAEHIKNLTELMRAYVRVGEVEKKTLGEVMTPQSLVNDMMDTLPLEVWSNPNLKWLDPCSGVGIFSGVIVERLMEGLKDAFPNDEERYKHIVENMIHVGELQPKNMFLFLAAFDPKDEYGMNVYTGSFLDGAFEEHAKNVWGVDKFDVIVMNPPYQQFFSESNKKSVPLWNKFVTKSISQLFEGGYLVAVHPDSWRRIDGDFKLIGNLLRSKQLIYLEIHNKYDGIKTFGASTTYDFYCLHNVKSEMFTKIKCQDGTIERADLSKMNFIPNGMFKEFEKLIAKGNDERVEILYSSSDYGNYKKEQMSKTQTTEHVYPCIYLTYKDSSYKLWYSNTKQKGHFDTPKVIFTNGISNPFLDENGEYGVMNFGCGIIDEPKNLPFIKKAMLHPDFIKLMSFSDGITGTGHRYNRKVIALFRKDFWKEFLD